MTRWTPRSSSRFTSSSAPEPRAPFPPLVTSIVSGITARFRGGLAHHVEQRHKVLVATPTREEAVAEPAGPPGRRLGVPTDVDRDGGLRGTGLRVHVLEPRPGPVERGGALRPQGAQRFDVLVGDAAPLREGHADRVELLLQPADPDAQLHPAARELIERRHLLGQGDGVALGEDEDARGEADPSVAAATRRARSTDPGSAKSSGPGICSGSLYGYGGRVPRRNHRVLDGPQRLEAGLSGRGRARSPPPSNAIGPTLTNIRPNFIDCPLRIGCGAR